ncbi:MAG: hypothetical protein ABL958_13770, partial [Bdellovibrionia bacterium]
MASSIKTRLFFCLIAISAGGTSQANVVPPEPKYEPIAQEFIDTNIEISEWFDDVAEGLDLFLVGRRLTRRPNETYVKIENSTFLKDTKGPNNVSSLVANVRLPNFEKYWQLKFTSYDDTREQRSSSNNYIRNAPRERNYGASVGLFRKLGNVRTSFQPRIDLSGSFKISHSLAFENIAEFRSWRINPKLEFYASPDRGVGTYQGLNFNFQLSKVLSLTLVNQGDYEEKLHRYSVTNGISFGHMIDEFKALSYNVFFLSNNRPNYHLQNYSFSISWSEVIYKKILDLILNAATICGASLEPDRQYLVDFRF